MACTMPIGCSSTSSSASISDFRSFAPDSRAMQARSVVTSTSGAGGASSAVPYTSLTDSTRYTSDPRSLNTPVMPACEAIPASLAFMHSNSGPESSVRR